MAGAFNLPWLAQYLHLDRFAQLPLVRMLSSPGMVVAANAGGAFSPFGDITTLMVWQKAKVQFSEFFRILDNLNSCNHSE